MNRKDNSAKLYEGVLMVRGRGTGFISLPGFDEDILIPPDSLATAFDGDVVEIELQKKTSSGRQTGAVSRIVERSKTEFIGNVVLKNTTVVLEPDGKRMHTPFLLKGDVGHAVGMKAAIQFLDWKEGADMPEGEIIEILGKIGEHETEMQAILRNGGFAVGFTKEVQDAAKELHDRQDDILREAITEKGRGDYRSITTFTIDPKDAKDFDDALSVEILENDLVRVGVHIADVSHYVHEKDPIDDEAVERGTSIYLVDRVIPMLPEVLSNELCSLRPDEDRLVFSAVFTIDKEGVVLEQKFGKGIIHSDKRFSYEEAQKVLDTKQGEFFEELSILMDISRQIRAKRHSEGAIAFDQPEVKFDLDENGKPLRVYAKERVETMLMIEDYMLLANRRVAEHIYKLCKDSRRDAAFVYRVHDAPDPEKVEELATFLHALGYEFRTKRGIVDAKDINTLLEEIEGKPEENLIKTATIRSMAKAVYSTKNIGHFGLAFKYYTHFTSPIRRYPDLMVHRLLLKHLNGTPISGRELARYEQLSIQSSLREVGAVEAERESIKYKQVEYMKDNVGKEFDAVVSGVTEWGIYVEEKESKAEGMIRLSSIKGDYYNYFPKSYSVRGEKTKKEYRLGDKVRVKLTRADLDERILDFELLK